MVVSCLRPYVISATLGTIQRANEDRVSEQPHPAFAQPHATSVDTTRLRRWAWRALSLVISTAYFYLSTTGTYGSEPPFELASRLYLPCT